MSGSPSGDDGCAHTDSSHRVEHGEAFCPGAQFIELFRGDAGIIRAPERCLSRDASGNQRTIEAVIAAAGVIP